MRPFIDRLLVLGAIMTALPAAPAVFVSQVQKPVPHARLTHSQPPVSESETRSAAIPKLLADKSGRVVDKDWS